MISKKEQEKILDSIRLIKEYNKVWAVKVPFTNLLENLPDGNHRLLCYIQDPDSLENMLRLFRSVNYDYSRRIKRMLDVKTLSYK